MKSFIVSVIIAVIVVAWSLFFVNQIEDFSVKLGVDLEGIVLALGREDYSSAGKLAKEMGDYVDEEKLRLAAMLDHTLLDKIETDIAELRGFIECEVKNDAIAKCRVLDVQIRHMPKNHKLKLENIL